MDNVAYPVLVDLSETGLRFDVWNFLKTTGSQILAFEHKSEF